MGNQKILETNYGENTATQNLWGAAKAVLRRKFIVIQSYLKKQEKHQIGNLTLHLKQLEKEEQKKTKKLVEGKKSSRSKQKFKRSERSNIKDYQCDTPY